MYFGTRNMKARTKKFILISVGSVCGLWIIAGIATYQLMYAQRSGSLDGDALETTLTSGQVQRVDVFEQAGNRGLRRLFYEMRLPESQIERWRTQVMVWAYFNLRRFGIAVMPPGRSLEVRAWVARSILSGIRRMPPGAMTIVLEELNSVPRPRKEDRTQIALLRADRIKALVGCLIYCGPDGARALTNILSSNPSIEVRSAAVAAIQRAVKTASDSGAKELAYPEIYIPALRAARAPPHAADPDQLWWALVPFMEMYPQYFGQQSGQETSPESAKSIR